MLFYTVMNRGEGGRQQNITWTLFPRSIGISVTSGWFNVLGTLRWECIGSYHLPEGNNEFLALAVEQHVLLIGRIYRIVIFRTVHEFDSYPCVVCAFVCRLVHALKWSGDRYICIDIIL